MSTVSIRVATQTHIRFVAPDSVAILNLQQWPSSCCRGNDRVDDRMRDASVVLGGAHGIRLDRGTLSVS